MSYQVIARKWRPQSFEEVTGQEPITRTLRNAIEHERLHQAYLFSGARGVGKTTTARLLAKALNCRKTAAPTPTPCRSDDVDACPSCREISDSRAIDVQEIDAASHTQVENVREVILGTVGIAPARDRYKIFIIDEVHMLSGHSFNALLKTIEEPPPRVIFIMATTERHKVPETILSRCQQFEFRTIATAKILERLHLIAQSEGIEVPTDALREIARSGEGSMRDAQSAFDQVISFAGSKLKKEDVEIALGIAGADILTRVIDGIAASNPSEALSVIDDVVMRGHDLRNFCRDLLAHLRDLLVMKVSGSTELLEAAVCDPAELKRQAALFSESDLVRFFHSLAETETKLQKAAHPRYQLEIGLVKLMEMRRLEPLSQILDRLSALEKSLRSSEPLPPMKRPPESSHSAEQSPVDQRTTRLSAGGSFTGAAVKSALEVQHVEEPGPPNTSAVLSKAAATGSEIERIKTALEGKRKMFLVTILEGAGQIRLEGGELHIEFAPEQRHFRDTLAKSENVTLLRDACREVTGKDLGVRIAIKEAGAKEMDSAKNTERRKKQELRESAEKDAIVQQMLRTFRGEIVDVRLADKE